MAEDGFKNRTRVRSMNHLGENRKEINHKGHVFPFPNSEENYLCSGES